MAKQTKQAAAKARNNGEAPLQMGFFTPECDWKPPEISSLPSWKGVKRIAIDVETRDPSIGNGLGTGQLRDGYTVGWAFAFDGGPKYYLPFRHEGGDNLPIEEVMRYMQDNIKHFEGEYVGANLAYDVDYGYSDNFQWNRNAKFRDVQIADPLINELEWSYSLVNIGKRWGIEAKDETVLREAAESYGVDPKKGLWRLPARYVGAYGEQDVTSPLDILREQEKVIDDVGLRSVWDLETDVLPALVRIRRRGVKIDFDKLAKIEAWAEKEERDAIALIHRETGVQVGYGNVWKPEALGNALEAIGMRLNKTSTGAPQINAEVLEGADHIVPTAILHARKVNKIRTTFAASIRKYEIDGRIHCSFKQIAVETESGQQKGVRYGRLSAIDPNMQQQPSPDRDPIIAGEWRKIFIPEDGALWGCNDYSQQEPRWTTHFAAKMGLTGAEGAAKKYRDDPTMDNHVMMTKLVYGEDKVEVWLRDDPKGAFKLHRGYSKAIFLGLCYGEGGAKLCHDIKKPTRWGLTSGWGKNRHTQYFETRMEAMSTRMDKGTGYVREMAGDEGQAILDNFNDTVPYVSELAKAASDRAKSRGYVETILGRHLHFELRDDGSYEKTHKALNRVIQGSSADQTKLAIVELDKADIYIQLQVHDETDGSFGTVEEARKAGDIMRDCILDRCTPLVPFMVDTETGPSWGEIK